MRPVGAALRSIGSIGLAVETISSTPFELELRMAVEDSPSAAGNVLDAVRYMQRALDDGLSGVIDPLAALLMKAPPRPMSGETARSGVGTMARE